MIYRAHEGLLRPDSLEETTILNVSSATKRKAATLILSCEACSDDAEIPFDYVLDWVTGLDPAVTDYVLSEPAKCPSAEAT